MSRLAIFIAILAICAFQGSLAAISAASCTTDGTNPAPNATNCQDAKGQASCQAIFPRTAGPPETRSDLCTNPDLESFAMDCANTCMICCETSAFNCGNDPTAPINCTANARYCTDPSWTEVMTKYCPGTCGFCASGTCKDVNSGCKDMITLCNDVNFQSYMQQNCQRTCNLCSSTGATTASPGGSTCSDVATNCAANAALCNNASYQTLMTQKCPKTCNRCSGTGGGSTCTDSNSNCGTWVANGFCSNSFYTTAQKQQYCGRSCNLC